MRKHYNKFLENASVILTLVGFIAFLSINNIPYLRDLIAENTPIIYFTIGLSFVGVILTQLKHNNNHLDAIENLKSDTRIREFDTSDDAHSDILGKIGSATTVKNVYFTNVGKSPADTKNYNASRIYQTWIAGKYGRNWYDIISPDVAFDDRYNKIVGVNNLERDKNIFVNVLKFDNISENFVIIEYNDLSKEVYWGWINKSDNIKTI